MVIYIVRPSIKFPSRIDSLTVHTYVYMIDLTLRRYLRWYRARSYVLCVHKKTKSLYHYICIQYILHMYVRTYVHTYVLCRFPIQYRVSLCVTYVHIAAYIYNTRIHSYMYCAYTYVGVYEIYRDPVARQKHQQKLAVDDTIKGTYRHTQGVHNR